MQPRRFVLTALDPEYGNPSFETLLVVERPEELRVLLDLSAEDDPRLEMSYRLEPHEAATIARHFGVQFASLDREIYLHPWRSLGEVPYLIHTNYELALMVDGSVLKGLRTVYYTRPGEEWRIKACRLVREASAKSGWNEHYERLESMLFGYEEWQTDWWIGDLRRRSTVYGTMLVWTAVDEPTLSSIEFGARRALPPPNGTIRLVCSFDEQSNDQEPRNLLGAADSFALVRLRVKARGFVALVGAIQKPVYELPPERIADLNRLIVGEIEIVVRAGGGPA